MNSTEKPLIIPIFIPHGGCPHQCAFCNQVAITHTGKNSFDRQLFDETVSRYMEYRGDRRLVQVSFYGGTFLGLERVEIVDWLESASVWVKRGLIDGIRFSTRPDTVTPETIRIIRDYPVKTVELGAQSMDARVLSMAKRGHTVDDTKTAVELLRGAGYEVGLQMMTGLPGDSEDSVMATGRAIADLNPDFVRIYPAVVLKGSLMARWYKNGEYEPFSLPRTVTVVKNLFLMFQSRRIPVIRMGLQAEEELDSGAVILSGPYHPAFGQLVHGEIFLDRARVILKEKLYEGDELEKDSSIDGVEEVSLSVHSKNISNMRGQKNANIEVLRELFNIGKIRVIGDNSLDMEEILVSLNRVTIKKRAGKSK